MRKAAPGRVLYFAFGANVDSAVVQRRGLKPASSEKGTLLNHKLYFNHVGGVLCTLIAGIEYNLNL